MKNLLKIFIISLFLFPSFVMAELPVVKLIATGGTIAMKIDPERRCQLISQKSTYHISVGGKD